VGKFLEGIGDQFDLATRQVAWLNTAPVDERKAALKSEKVPEPMTRLQQMEADGIEPTMPPLPPGLYLDWLLELGPTEAAGMGAAAISWRTIEAWCIRTGNDPSPWESKLLRRLSSAWLAEADRARKPDCPAPWSDQPAEQHRATVAAKVSAAFRAMIHRPPRNPPAAE
jgi:hypothetical protein